MTISEYMNLRSIDGTKIIAVRDIHRVLIQKYSEISRGIHLLAIENRSESSIDMTVTLEIPSETYTGVFYTVVLQFLDDHSTEIRGKTSIKIMSNSPAFAFTYAFVFNKSKLLVEELKETVLNRLQLTKPPVKRNPKRMVGLTKDVFFAIHYVSVNKSKFNVNTKSRKIKNKRIPTSDDIVVSLNAAKKIPRQQHYQF